MATSTPIPARQNGLLLLPAIARLAGWRFKKMWRFLFVTELALLAVVVLACAGPLFARIATSAYVRSEIANAPDGSYVTIDTISTHPTQAQFQQIQQQIDRLIHQGVLASYLPTAPQVIVQTPSLDILLNGQTKPAAFHIDGYDSALASQHASVVQGRLPRVTTGNTVEIALSQVATASLGLHIGSTFQGRYPISAGSQLWNLRVVGIIAPKVAHDPFWAMANPFSTSTIALNSRYYRFLDAAPAYGALAANEVIRPKIAVLQTAFNPDFSGVFAIFWRYQFDLAQLDAKDLPALSQRTTDLDTKVQDTLQRNISELAYSNVFGTAFTTLEFSSASVAYAQITVTFLSLITLGLVLFLISLMSDILIERQAEIIATLRSRGATRWHIFGAFVTQGLLLGGVALIAGPLLALLLVRVIAQYLLTSDNSSAINVITSNPIQAALDVKAYALIAVAVALLVLIIAVNRATKMDIVSFRRESSRPQRVPLWRRFYLDVFIGLLLLAGYIVYTYLWTYLTLSSSRIDPVIYNVLTSVGFLTTPLIVVCVLLLFLRLFPLILRLATYLVAKRRSAAAMLAFAQMERKPRPAGRMIVLLALAIASSCFLLTLVASKEQRNIDAATFANEAADFSGSLPTTDTSKTYGQLQAYYNSLSGVQSATLGYHDVIPLSADQGLTGQGSVTISAVDADTYAHTAIWPASYTSSPLSKLTAQLVVHRSDANERNVVYALADTATWQRLHLAEGAQFTLPASSSGNSHINYIALARVNYVPGVYDTPTLTWSGMGLIVDYQSYAVVKAKATGVRSSSLLPNYIWLRTSNDTTSLARLRTILPDLNDRNQVIAIQQNDPNHLSIIGVLAIGVGAALLLALIGSLILSWLNASNRITNFAVARALGMAPRQIAAVLLWEQGLIYLLALLLGLVLGAMLLFFVAPIIGSLPMGLGLNQPFDIPAIQVVIPYPQLLLLLGICAIICLLSLLLMARAVSRPSLGQTLRLNED